MARIAEYQEAFNLFDEDHDGQISTSVIGTLMRSLGFMPTEQEIRDIVSDCDGDDVDFEQFCTIIEENAKPNPTADEVANAFRVFDKNGDGSSLDIKDIVHVLSVLGETLNEKEIERMVREADPQSTGSFNYENFAKVLVKV